MQTSTNVGSCSEGCRNFMFLHRFSEHISFRFFAYVLFADVLHRRPHPCTSVHTQLVCTHTFVLCACACLDVAQARKAFKQDERPRP